MASYNPSNDIQTTSTNRTFFSRILRNLSSWGMDYENMILKNRVGFAEGEDPNAVGSMYDTFSQRAISKSLQKTANALLDPNYQDKKRILREYSIKDEIRDYITIVAEEAIMYDDENMFCDINNLPDDYDQTLKDEYMEVFQHLYSRMELNDGKLAYELFRDFIIDGYLCLELIYDDKMKEIIGFEKLPPDTIVPGIDPASGKKIWIQNPDNPQIRVTFLDVQIVYIAYSSHGDLNETSYVEGLLRPYNQLKLIEQTRIMFNMANATHYQLFKIPTEGLSKQKAEESISQLISDYSEEVEFDDTMGTVRINGQKHLPYNKQLWFPESSLGTPSYEIISPEGHNLNESDMLTWFYNNLKRASRIPFSRFDKDNGGGNVFSDAAEMTRDETRFTNFVTRLQKTFAQILIKPLYIQMCINKPELRKDEIFKNKVSISFNTDSMFEEWKRLHNDQKRAEVVSTMLSTITNPDGTPYFHIEFLMDKYYKLSEEDRQANQAAWRKYGANAEAGEGGEFGGGEGGDFGGEGGDFGGEGDFEPGGDFGDEDFGPGDETFGDEGGGEETGGGEEPETEF